jgi:hypothetical protein
MAAEMKESPVLKTLTADDILAANDLKVEAVDVPEWGGRVFVRTMSAGKRDEYDASIRPDDEKLDLVNFRARLVAYTCCDAEGKLLFNVAQIVQLAQKSSLALIRVFRAAQKINKLGSDAVADEKKDSSEVPSGGSPTGSPSSPAQPGSA